MISPAASGIAAVAVHGVAIVALLGGIHDAVAALCQLDYACPDYSPQKTIDKGVAKVEPQIAAQCTDALVPIVRGPSCASASTVSELASCQVSEHDTATDALMTLLQ